MNAKNLNCLLMLLSLMTLWGCINNLAEEQTQDQAQEETVKNPSLTLEYNTITLSANGFYGTIAIYANVDYLITSSASYGWISFERREEGVYLKLDKNDSEEMRGIILYIENVQYGLQNTLTVFQEGSETGYDTTDNNNDGYVDDGYDGETSSTTHQCMAITQKGTQCKRNAMEGSDYCWQHQPDVTG